MRSKIGPLTKKPTIFQNKKLDIRDNCFVQLVYRKVVDKKIRLGLLEGLQSISGWFRGYLCGINSDRDISILKTFQSSTEALNSASGNNWHFTLEIIPRYV